MPLAAYRLYDNTRLYIYTYQLIVMTLPELGLTISLSVVA